jgi:hypothetical protein
MMRTRSQSEFISALFSAPRFFLDKASAVEQLACALARACVFVGACTGSPMGTRDATMRTVLSPAEMASPELRSVMKLWQIVCTSGCSSSCGTSSCVASARYLPPCQLGGACQLGAITATIAPTPAISTRPTPDITASPAIFS